MKLLFLDDDMTRQEHFTDLLRAHSIEADDYRAQTIAEAIVLLKGSASYEQPFDYAFLDHDLDGQIFVQQRERTGQLVADYIARMPAESRPRRVVIHSFNPDGAIEMQRILQSVGVRAQRAMFGTTVFEQVIVNIKQS